MEQPGAALAAIVRSGRSAGFNAAQPVNFADRLGFVADAVLAAKHSGQ